MDTSVSAQRAKIDGDMGIFAVRWSHTRDRAANEQLVGEEENRVENDMGSTHPRLIEINVLLWLIPYRKKLPSVNDNREENVKLFTKSDR